MNLSRDGKRCPWRAMEAVDRLHTMLADDCDRAGDKARAEWHRQQRDDQRHAVDAFCSAWCGRPVTGYGEGYYVAWH
ncbi:MAG: hypothetical protein ACRC6L_12980 [Steroidobacteraceae bacterium]